MLNGCRYIGCKYIRGGRSSWLLMDGCWLHWEISCAEAGLEATTNRLSKPAVIRNGGGIH